MIIQLLSCMVTIMEPEEQEQFTALPIHSLEMTHERHPIVILINNEPVGFFVLHSSDRVKEYSDNPKAMLLTSFSINHSHQGKGFAKRGMQQIEDFVKRKFPACDEIVLAVNKRNIAAQKLYEKVGYKDTGRRKMGKIGENKRTLFIYPIYVILLFAAAAMLFNQIIVGIIVFTIVSILVLLILTKKVISWFGGMTGDVLGASVEGMELALWMILWLFHYFAMG